MKLFALAAAAAVAVTGMAAPAVAQRTVVHERTVVRHGPAPRAWHTRRACSTQWRNHHRVRVCRTVRYH